MKKNMLIYMGKKENLTEMALYPNCSEWNQNMARVEIWKNGIAQEEKDYLMILLGTLKQVQSDPDSFEAIMAKAKLIFPDEIFILNWRNIEFMDKFDKDCVAFRDNNLPDNVERYLSEYLEGNGFEADDVIVESEES